MMLNTPVYECWRKAVEALDKNEPARINYHIDRMEEALRLSGRSLWQHSIDPRDVRKLRVIGWKAWAHDEWLRATELDVRGAQFHINLMDTHLYQLVGMGEGLKGSSPDQLRAKIFVTKEQVQAALVASAIAQARSFWKSTKREIHRADYLVGRMDGVLSEAGLTRAAVPVTDQEVEALLAVGGFTTRTVQ